MAIKLYALMKMYILQRITQGTFWGLGRNLVIMHTYLSSYKWSERWNICDILFYLGDCHCPCIISSYFRIMLITWDKTVYSGCKVGYINLIPDWHILKYIHGWIKTFIFYLKSDGLCLSAIPIALEVKDWVDLILWTWTETSRRRNCNWCLP